MFKKYLWLSPILFAFLLSFSITLSYPYPIGADIQFHITQARNLFTTGNIVPYPPLFLALLEPSIIFHVEQDFAKLLQIICYPLAIASSMFLIKKYADKSAACFGGFLLLSSFAFFDRVFQAQPQALDFILLPIVFNALLSDEHDRFSVGSFLLLLNHAPLSFFALVGSYIKATVKNWYMIIGFTIFWIVTLTYFAIPDLANILETNIGLRKGGSNDLAICNNPLITIPYLLGPLTISLFYVAFNAKNYHKLTELEKLSLLTILGMTIMIPLWISRFIQYITMPLCYFLVKRMGYSKYRVAYAGPIALFMFIPWLLLLANGYDMRVPIV